MSPMHYERQKIEQLLLVHGIEMVSFKDQVNYEQFEAYFAMKLLDYELSSNNGNGQWAAGTGCDAAPYFRIFNPIEQLKKFDTSQLYVKKWGPEFGTSNYPLPMVEHIFARKRALESDKAGILQ